MIWNRVIDSAARISALLGGVTILSSALLVSLEVLSRNAGLGLRLHAFEITNYGFAGAVAFGFAFAATRRAHIRVDVLYQFLPLSARAVLDAISMLLLTCLASGMAWHAWRVVAQSVKLGARPNSTLDIPLAVPQALWATGLSWFVLITMALSICAIIQLLRGQLAALHASAGVVVDEGPGGNS